MNFLFFVLFIGYLFFQGLIAADQEPSQQELAQESATTRRTTVREARLRHFAPIALITRASGPTAEDSIAQRGRHSDSKSPVKLSRSEAMRSRATESDDSIARTSSRIMTADSGRATTPNSIESITLPVNATTCPVCLIPLVAQNISEDEEPQKQKSLIILACGEKVSHGFHKHCLRRWEVEHRSKECPSCKQNYGVIPENPLPENQEDGADNEANDFEPIEIVESPAILLRRAIDANDAPAVIETLNRGAFNNLNTVFGGMSRYFPMHHAAQFNNSEIIRSIHQHDPQRNHLNMRNGFGYCPLHYAVQKGITGVVETLVELGADVNAIVMTASFISHETPLTMLLQAPINAFNKRLCLQHLVTSPTITQTTRDQALLVAVERNNNEAINVLCENHARINCLIHDQTTFPATYKNPLLLARNNPEITSQLLGLGATLDTLRTIPGFNFAAVFSPQILDLFRAKGFIVD